MNEDNQIERIKSKLVLAKEKDLELRIFGASRHKYVLNPPLSKDSINSFEQECGISLPSCYCTFITEVGNGGISYANSAAGPDYGIYPFSTNLDEFTYVDDDKHSFLRNECILYPEMSDEYWAEISKAINGNEEISDEEYNKARQIIFGGILPIGTEGCTYFHGLVLNGDYRGKVVNIDTDGQKPFFANGDNFLSWYEGWLDGII